MNRRVEICPRLIQIMTMPMTLEQIVEEPRQWPEDVVGELIERITLAKHGGIDPKIERAWGDVAERRLAEIESGKVKPVPGEKVSERIRKIVGR